MQKKKFDLTADIVDINTDENEQNNEIYKTERSKKINNPNVLLSISLEEEKRREFKTWCVKNGLKMNEAFLKGFELLKKQRYM